MRKAEIERYLIHESRSGGVPSTVVHPGHISGGGWPVITPVGNLDPAVWTALATGAPLAVPGSGSETMHHVHADDVAQVVQLAVVNRETAVGESFHAVSERALSVRGFAHAAAAWFGREAELEHLDWDGFRARTDPEHADASWEHLSRSHVASIEKARDVLGYAPRYTSEEAAREAVEWMVRSGELDVPLPAERERIRRLRRPGSRRATSDEARVEHEPGADREQALRLHRGEAGQSLGDVVGQQRARDGVGRESVRVVGAVQDDRRRAEHARGERQHEPDHRHVHLPGERARSGVEAPEDPGARRGVGRRGGSAGHRLDGDEPLRPEHQVVDGVARARHGHAVPERVRRPGGSMSSRAVSSWATAARRAAAASSGTSATRSAA
ncbi:NAD-dependent epimerase/dehydratase family protein [Clavibacter tessellarius]